MCISQAVKGGFRIRNIEEIAKHREPKVEDGEKTDQKVDEYSEKE